MSDRDQMIETAINLIAEGSRLEGKIHLDNVTRIHGTISGEIFAKDGSTLILGETALVEGNIQGDVILVDGFVEGNISAKTRLFISRTGRVIGDVHTRDLKLEFGGFFEGRCVTESRSTSNLEP